MESEEITKLVDGIYKNILEKFNPGTRQMINAGKAYLKALHGSAAASRVYVDAITKLARQAQQATWTGCSDIGSALMQIVEVCKETQAQQMNILKAFYVDVLVPLETNLEKDTKVVQTEQKRFLQQHKQHIESYTKAAANVKKYRKKHGRNSKNLDKELKSMQALEDEKNKLDEFCEQSLKHAITQERRRYGFVLERQTSLAKHKLAFYEKQQVLMEKYLNSWNEIAKNREHIPEAVENMFTTNLTQINFFPEEPAERLDSPDDEDVVSVNSQLRKSRSVDSSGIDNSPTQELPPEPKPLVKAKSEFNISGSTISLQRSEECSTLSPSKPKLSVSEDWENRCLVRALFSYLSNGENQLSFLKGDLISVIGNRNKGWQYGENVRTKFSGWFPMAYAELVSADGSVMNSPRKHRSDSFSTKNGDVYGSSVNGDAPEIDKLNSKYMSNKTAVHKFGDSVVQRHPSQVRRAAENPFNSVPPPVMPAPIVPVSHHHHVDQRESRNPPPQAVSSGNGKKAQNGNASLHSSNDSGFSNDPPPAPDVDYSDDEAHNRSHSYAKKGDKSSSRAASNLHQNGKKKEYTSSVSDWLNDEVGGGGNSEYTSATLYSKRRYAPMRQSSSVGHLVTLGRMSNQAQSEKDLNLSAYDKKIKRTKSLWKFKKVDDLLEGMSMWKHRSLVDINANPSDTVSRGTPVPDKRMAVTREISVDSGDENSTLMNGTQGKSKANKIFANGSRRQAVAAAAAATTTTADSDDSDQESCIVVNDHRKSDSISVASKLPRTHLSKTNSLTSMKLHQGNGVAAYGDYKDGDGDAVFESNKLQMFKSNRMAESAWYDSWGERRKK